MLQIKPESSRSFYILLSPTQISLVLSQTPRLQWQDFTKLGSIFLPTSSRTSSWKSSHPTWTRSSNRSLIPTKKSPRIKFLIIFICSTIINSWARKHRPTKMMITQIWFPFFHPISSRAMINGTIPRPLTPKADAWNYILISSPLFPEKRKVEQILQWMAPLLALFWRAQSSPLIAFWWTRGLQDI